MVLGAINPHDHSRFPKQRPVYRKASKPRRIAEWHGHSETPHRIRPRQSEDGSIVGRAPYDLRIPPAARNVFEEERRAGWRFAGLDAANQDRGPGWVQFRPAAPYSG